LRNFIWNNEGRPTIGDNTLQAKYDEGGKNTLDISARNTAIELNWLKTYIRQDSDHPTWAFFADALIANKACPKSVIHPETQVNIFLQTWKTQTKTSTLPERHRKMLKTAKECKLQFDFLAFTPYELQKLPI